MTQLQQVRIAAVKQLTPIIREFTFEAQDQALQPFSAGSHIVVNLPVQGRLLRNAYSLLSDPQDNSQYQIAVRLQAQSRGGSSYLHHQAKPGDLLELSYPHNLFALHSQAQHHILIAGGIGITPFLSHIKYLLTTGGSFELHYACRDQLSNAYQSMLSEQLHHKLHLYSERSQQRLNLAEVLAAQPLNSHVYVCGPDRLIAGVQQAAQQIGWADKRVHWEAFQAPAAGSAFDVHLLQRQQHIHVPSEYSLLEALEEHGVAVPNLCRGGVCGQCAVKYRKGEVEHHDHFLSDAEKQQLLMPCVSRAKHGCSIELEL